MEKAQDRKGKEFEKYWLKICHPPYLEQSVSFLNILIATDSFKKNIEIIHFYIPVKHNFFPQTRK